MTSLPTVSLEYVELPFTDHVGNVTDVELALVRPGLAPVGSDWHPADWDGETARLLVGPDGVMELPVGIVYVLWLRFRAGEQRPARATGYVVADNSVLA